MANLYSRLLTDVHAYDIGNGDGYSAQLHITSECDLKCKHCYMYDSNYRACECEWESLKLLIDETVQKARKVGKQCTLVVTGGDPILASIFWQTLDYIDGLEDVQAVVLGNSFHIGEAEAIKLKSHGIAAYQMSLDGLEEKHDSNRRKGAFKDVIRALAVLHNAGVTTQIMFTVSKHNSSDFIPLLEYLDDLGTVDAVGFDKMIPEGNAKKRDDFLSAKEYKDFLFSVFLELRKRKYSVKFPFKDNLWKLLFWELGLCDPFDDERQVVNGCLVCSNTFSLLPDGQVQLCRRMGDKGLYNSAYYKGISKLDRSFYYNREIYDGCKDCEIWAFCRGCLADRDVISCNYISKDTYCWKV